MAELESAIEKSLIDKLCHDTSQWTYRPDIKTEKQLWDNFKYILEQNNKAKLNDIPLSDAEFDKIKNDVSHASFYEAGKWLIGENGKVYVHIQRGNETLHLLVMNNEHICGGTSVYEVINQYQAFATNEEEDVRDRRFDVTLLINGLPLIHIELKNKNHSYMDGYYQIKKYISEGKFHGIFSPVTTGVAEERLIRTVWRREFFGGEKTTLKKFLVNTVPSGVAEEMDDCAGSERFCFGARFGAEGILCVFRGDKPQHRSKRSADLPMICFRRNTQLKRERGECPIHPAVAPVSLMRDYSACDFTHGSALRRTEPCGPLHGGGPEPCGRWK